MAVKRRIVLLSEQDPNEVEKVLAEFQGNEAKDKDIHVEIERHAARQKGRTLGGEWESERGWVRFLTCKK